MPKATFCSILTISGCLPIYLAKRSAIYVCSITVIHTPTEKRSPLFLPSLILILAAYILIKPGGSTPINDPKKPISKL